MFTGTFNFKATCDVMWCDVMGYHDEEQSVNYICFGKLIDSFNL